MKRTIFTVILSLFVFQTVMAQQAQPTPTPVKEANPADVASIDAIIKATYEVISGDAGVKRDWDRFRSLFYRGARLIPTGKNPQTGVYGGGAATPDEYIKRSEPFFDKEGFYESEIGRRTELYGNIAHVFSTYESKHSPSDKKTFARGINSFQLLNDGKRWWVVTIFWQGETTDNPIPKKYLKTVKD